MATTTANLTLSSSDLTSDALSISSTATLYKDGTTVGLDQSSGLNKKVYAGTQTATVLVANSSYTTGKNHKVYIKNTGTSSTDAFLIILDATALDSAAAVVNVGRLYGGDWMFIPWEGRYDIEITTTATNMELEYMVIYEA
tara:strand:+ start:190 stop:612 length:423 start_codon:yes stop_codon:yes gene_type:complete